MECAGHGGRGGRGGHGEFAVVVSKSRLQQGSTSHVDVDIIDAVDAIDAGREVEVVKFKVTQNSQTSKVDGV